MVTVGGMVFAAHMASMLSCYRASPGSGTTLLRSIDPDNFDHEYKLQ